MDTAASYHENVYQPCFELADDLGLDCDCLGGGRIKMDTAAKTIFVYGTYNIN